MIENKYLYLKMDDKQLHGYYSNKQLLSNKESYEYLDLNNKKILVTEVCKHKKDIFYFDDMIYIGPLKYWIRTISS